MADVIEANSGELARLLTSEQGKPLADATGEVMRHGRASSAISAPSTCR